MTVTLIAGAVAWCSVSSPVFAQEPKPLCPICKKMQEKNLSYGEKAGNALARGALNTGLGWTELIRQPAQEAKRGGNPLLGIANGLGRGLVRTFSGLAEVATFWTPKVEGQYLHIAHDCPLDANQ